MSLYYLGFLIIASIGLIVYALWPKENDEGDAIKRRMSGKRSQNAVSDVRKKAKDSVAKKMVEAVAPIAIRPSMMSNSEEMSKLRIKLAMGGFRSDSTATTFLASKSIAAVVFAIAAGGYAWMKGVPMMNGMGYILMGAGFGFLAPDMWLSSAISKRQDSIRRGLPDTLDLMVITVESGLGLDASIQRVGDEMKAVHPNLSEELQMVTVEAQMGVPRAEAMVNFATRTGIDEIKSLVAIINQAERFGTSIARALRNQSKVLRTKRRQAAEEKAQKTTVKLMAPLILFIFPAILVVLAGPAALKMIEALENTPGLI